jgi:hypothetical protein
MSRDVNLRKDRRDILAIFGGTIIAVILLLFFGLRPAVKEQSHMRAEMIKAKQMLLPYQEGGGSESLGQELSVLQRENFRLQRTWDTLKEQVGTFKEGSSLRGALPSTEEGWIKFKVQLIEARADLMKRAAELNIQLPEDLGIEESSEEAEDPEVRLWQLASLVKLMNQCMESGIQSVYKAEALPPLPVFAEGEKFPVQIEYPVLIRMTGTFDAALALLDSLEGEGRFFALRRFQIKRLKRNSGKLLDILTVCSAVPFSERNIQDSATASPGGSEVSGDESPGVRRRERREE